MDRLYGMGDVQQTANVAGQSTGDERAGTRCCRQQFLVYDIPDDYEDPISVVAPASGWLRTCERYRDGRLVVSDFPELVGEGDCTEDWWREALSASGAVLFRANLGRLYTWMCVEPNRIGHANADVYCVALMH